MAKIKDLGWAGPDDPIYQGGVMVHFKPGLVAPGVAAKPAAPPVGKVPTVAAGRYAVVCEYSNWDAGSCLDRSIPRIALCSTMEDAEQLFTARAAQISAALNAECETVNAMGNSPRGLSGYTTYCILFEIDESRDAAGWESLFRAASNDDPIESDDDPIDISGLIRRFEGYNAKPEMDGLYCDLIQYANVEEMFLADYAG